MSTIPSEAITQIVTRALNSARGIEIVFDSERQATHFRHRFYAVRRAVLKTDPQSEWGTLSCIKEANRIRIVPAESDVLALDIKEL